MGDTVILSQVEADLLASILTSLRSGIERGHYPDADCARFRQEEALGILRSAGALPTWERYAQEKAGRPPLTTPTQETTNA